MFFKIDADATAGTKLLRLFRKLMLDGRKLFQADLTEELQCSSQTIIRLISEIESVAGISLESDIENRKKSSQIKTIPRFHLRLNFEELRYLALCCDLAKPILLPDVLHRIDDILLNFSVLTVDRDYAQRAKAQDKQFSFYSKGEFDYIHHLAHIKKLTKALEQKQVCLVRYKVSGKGAAKEHRFAPAKIVAMNNALYVLGATLEEDFSSEKYFFNFAIHRIVDIILLERSFIIKFPQFEKQTFGLPWHEPKSFFIYGATEKAAD